MVIISVVCETIGVLGMVDPGIGVGVAVLGGKVVGFSERRRSSVGGICKTVLVCKELVGTYGPFCTV